MAKPGQDLIREIIGRLPLPARVEDTLLLVYDTFHNYGLHRGGETAAAIAYYSLFALFPLILFTMSALGYLLGSSVRQADVVQAVVDRIPGSRDLIESTVHQVVQARGPLTIVALVTLLWSASGVFSMLAVAINRPWSTAGGRPFLQEKLVGISLALLIGLLVLIAIASSGAVQIAREFGDTLFPPDLANIMDRIDAFGLLLGITANTAAFFVIYKFVPTIHVPWQAALLGAATGGIAWEVAKYVFSWYLSTFAIRNFTMVYGSLSAVLALLLWIYFSAVILLLGAELSATYVQGTFRSRPRLRVEGHE